MARYTLKPSRKEEWKEFLAWLDKIAGSSSYENPFINYHTRRRVEEGVSTNQKTLIGIINRLPKKAKAKYPDMISTFFRPAKGQEQESIDRPRLLHRKFAAEAQRLRSIGDQDHEILPYFYDRKKLKNTDPKHSVVVATTWRLLNLHKAVVRHKDELAEEDWRVWLDGMLLFYNLSPVYKQQLEDEEKGYLFAPLRKLLEAEDGALNLGEVEEEKVPEYATV